MKKNKNSTKSNNIDRDKLEKALIKKATGYHIDETVEEYVSSETGELTLSKRKVTKKLVPPDTAALKTLLEIYNSTSVNKLSELTDEELEKEKLTLLNLLKEDG